MSLLNFIKNIFKTDSAQQSETKFIPDADAYYFHEDYYCQIEYLPKENFSNASKVATEIMEHSEKTFDGNGWTGCYIRNEAKVPTKNKNYKVTELAELLVVEGFSEFPSVTTGYSTAVFPCDNTRAFKKQSIILCFDFKGDIIPLDNYVKKKMIWNVHFGFQYRRWTNVWTLINGSNNKAAHNRCVCNRLARH